MFLLIQGLSGKFMAKLPGYRRILEQDYPQQYQDIVRQLSVTLNYAFDTIFQLLNGKLTFADNIASTVKEVSVKVDAAGIPQTKVTITKSSTDKIAGIIVARVINADNSTIYPTGGVTISYTETVDSIIINHITGLQANSNYNINIITVR
jgi:hypothetical protein